jgi:hypothetical protein
MNRIQILTIFLGLFLLFSVPVVAQVPRAELGPVIERQVGYDVMARFRFDLQTASFAKSRTTFDEMVRVATRGLEGDLPQLTASRFQELVSESWIELRMVDATLYETNKELAIRRAGILQSRSSIKEFIGVLAKAYDAVRWDQGLEASQSQKAKAQAALLERYERLKQGVVYDPSRLATPNAKACGGPLSSKLSLPF